jgi:small subunit ribosomal protein S3
VGQKVNPVSFRLPLSPTETWKSRWFTTSPKRYSAYLGQDMVLRKALMSRLKAAGVANVEIERSLRSLKVTVHVARPGVVIGRGGSGIEEVKSFIAKTLTKPGQPTPKAELQVEEIEKPDLNSYLVAVKIAEQLEKRLPARRVVKKTIDRTMQAGAKGMKVLLAGRIGGAEISRRELYNAAGGSVPLQTMRANIDYAQVPALTRSGYIGVKVWIYKGEKE